MIKKIIDKLDIIFFILIITLLNLHLIGFNFSDNFIFYPEKIISGQWYRIFTYPFVHLTHYHFLLDVGAFFLLYIGFKEKNIWKKVFYVLICSAGSLLAALIIPTKINTLGLCGLSGIAHGLMAINSIEMIVKNNSKIIGTIGLVLLISKAVYEAVVFFKIIQHYY